MKRILNSPTFLIILFFSILQACGQKNEQIKKSFDAFVEMETNPIEFMRERRFTLKEFGFSPRVANHWIEKGIVGDSHEAKKKISEGLGKSFPDLAHLPPGEAIKAITERFTPAGISHAPPTKAEVEAKLAEAKKQIEDIASGAAFADLRRLSPAPTPEEFSWDPAFAERLGALIKELSANSEGLAGRDFAGVKMPGLALPGAPSTSSALRSKPGNQLG